MRSIYDTAFTTNTQHKTQTKMDNLFLVRTSIIQLQHLSLFAENCKRPPGVGRPRITWMNTVLNDLKSHNLTLTKAANMALNCPLWRMLRTLIDTGHKWRWFTSSVFTISRLKTNLSTNRSCHNTAGIHQTPFTNFRLSLRLHICSSIFCSQRFAKWSVWPHGQVNRV